MTLTGLPTDGGAVWVRLMSHIGGAWQWIDQRYTAASPTPARITSPGTGSRLMNDTTVFTWSAGVDADAYWLNVGCEQGGYDLYSGYMGASRAANITVPPMTGPVWVRLLSRIGGNWVFVDQMYISEGAAPAQVLTPSSTSAVDAGAVVLTWTTGRGVKAYWLDLGTSPGGYDISSGYRGTSLSAVVSGVPAGRISVRLWSLIDGAWKFVDSSFEAR